MGFFKNVNKVKLGKVFNLCVIFISIGYVYLSIISYKFRFKDIDIEIDYLCIFIASILLFLVYMIYVGLWRGIMSFLKCPISFKKLAYVYFSTLLYKYIPGKIWVPIWRIVYLTNGKNKKNLALSLFLDLIFKVFAGFIIGMICFFILLKQFQVKLNQFNVCFIIVLLFISVLVIVFIYKKNVFFCIFLKSLSNKKAYVLRIFVILTLIYCFTICLEGLSFFLIINAVTDSQELLYSIGTKAIAKSIFSAVPVSHVGTTEATYVFFLKKIIKFPYFFIIPLLYRVWKIFCELTLFIFFKLYKFSFLKKYE